MAWDDAEKTAFVEMQFRAQVAVLPQEHYPNTSFDVIVLDGQEVGRLYVSR